MHAAEFVVGSIWRASVPSSDVHVEDEVLNIKGGADKCIASCPDFCSVLAKVVASLSSCNEVSLLKVCDSVV